MYMGTSLTLPRLQADRSSDSACCTLLIVREPIVYTVLAVLVVIIWLRGLQMHTDRRWIVVGSGSELVEGAVSDSKSLFWQGEGDV